MKFTLSWLKDHLDTDATVEQVAERLTAIGLEVEGIDDPAAALAPFVIARVLTAAPHPQADKLQILSVDAGGAEPLQVVCGAPNARAGLVGVFGAPGAYVPGLDVTLKVAAIRGVESRGMMCSKRELLLSDEHEGIIELPADAPVGTAFADYAALSDPVIDVAITPNRQDCMGVRGIARDLAAAGLGTLKSLIVPTIRPAFPCPIAIRTDDAEGCPALFGRVVRGVTNGPSPDWMARRLTAVGQRPISALVDMTNYVMLDHGRPLHVYDLATLRGALVARKAAPGETLTALNGRDYALSPAMTVIADDQAVHDIGGIMGGLHSGVTAETTDIVVECAWFEPTGIAKTGQALALSSDARTRFERGVDPEFVGPGLALATELILQHCGGEPSDVVEAGSPPDHIRVIAHDPTLCLRLAGMTVSNDRQRRILTALGFGVDAAWNVRVPSWRRDIDGPADLVEEVVRIEGLDRVPSTPLPRAEGVARPTATAAQLLERRVRRMAAARGLSEAVTWSFVSDAEAAAFGGGAWRLTNPISAEMRVMRPSLLPGLLSAAKRNADRGAASLRLFEIGRRYLADGEPATLGFVLLGDRQPRDWRTGKPAAFDAYDAKAEALALLAAAGVAVDRVQVMAPVSPVWHPGRSGTLRLGPKTILAAFGELHPATVRAMGLDGQVVGGEVYLDAVPQKRGSGPVRPAFVPPALQAVRRDFAFVVPRTLVADDLVRAVRGADKTAIVEARVFDLFALADGDLSIAVEVMLQPAERSFTEAELTAVADKVVAAAAKVGARLR